MYDWDWRRYRAWFIAQVQCSVCGANHTICAECRTAGRFVVAFAVDHIVPHRGDPKLFHDHTNLQSLCEKHHNQKSGRETMERGNPARK